MNVNWLLMILLLQSVLGQAEFNYSKRPTDHSFPPSKAAIFLVFLPVSSELLLMEGKEMVDSVGRCNLYLVGDFLGDLQVCLLKCIQIA